MLYTNDLWYELVCIARRGRRWRQWQSIFKFCSCYVLNVLDKTVKGTNNVPMMFASAFSRAPPSLAPESMYAWLRLAVSMVIGTAIGVGMWAVVVVLPTVQADFGTGRGDASLPFTCTMIGFGLGTLCMGRVVDRFGIVLPIVFAAGVSGAGFGLAAFAPSLLLFALAHIAVGFGTSVGFGPMMADISHWFVKRRALAVVLVACGNYLAGTIWPLFMRFLLPVVGWRMTYLVVAGVVLAVSLPLVWFLRHRPLRETMVRAEAHNHHMRGALPLSPGMVQALLMLAGVSCCLAMAMPQVHLVAYCGDLGYGPARGAEMLSLMLFLGVFSRIGSGFLADRIGGGPTLLIGSIMQGAALTLYLFFDGLASLYIISGIFGLFQGGIVPMYAVLCREYLPPKDAGARIGMVVTATIVGMALGGYASGVIFDLTRSYQLAFIHGIAWNGVNIGVISWLLWQVRERGGAGAGGLHEPATGS